ncbi:hypothetical protein HYW55_00325 [Candidatus Gottesmanbacteria bacterium]|nr:hypothetical protein [Candidatus Gottesmanbacteria bacterium]
MIKNIYHILVALLVLVFLIAVFFLVRLVKTDRLSPSEWPAEINPTSGTEQSYTNEDLGLSLKYPLTYSMEDLTATSRDFLLALSFIPSGKDAQSPILVTVLPKRNSKNLSDWIVENTTSSGDLSSGKFLLYQVNNVIYRTVNDKEAAKFTIGDPDIADPLVATLFLTDKYAIFVAQQAQKIGSSYHQMISSLSFD